MRTMQIRQPVLLLLIVMLAGFAGPEMPPALARSVPPAGTNASEIEPINTCQTAQPFGSVTLPFSVSGRIDSAPENPDIDFYRFTAPPGAQWWADVEGSQTGQGTLNAAFVEQYDSACKQVDAYVNYLTVPVPDDGIVILAVSSPDDPAGGSYLLTVSPGVFATSVSGRVVDGQTAAPLVGAWVELRRCGAVPDSLCTQPWQQATTDASGRFTFLSTPATPWTDLIAGRYQLVAGADGYGEGRSRFTLSANEVKDAGDIPLGKPVRRSLLHPLHRTPAPSGR